MHSYNLIYWLQDVISYRVFYLFGGIKTMHYITSYRAFATVFAKGIFSGIQLWYNGFFMGCNWDENEYSQYKWDVSGISWDTPSSVIEYGVLEIPTISSMIFPALISGVITCFNISLISLECENIRVNIPNHSKMEYNIDIIDSILEYQYNPKPCPWIPWIWQPKLAKLSKLGLKNTMLDSPLKKKKHNERRWHPFFLSRIGLWKFPKSWEYPFIAGWLISMGKSGW